MQTLIFLKYLDHFTGCSLEAPAAGASYSIGSSNSGTGMRAGMRVLLVLCQSQYSALEGEATAGVWSLL